MSTQTKIYKKASKVALFTIGYMAEHLKLSRRDTNNYLTKMVEQGDIIYTYSTGFYYHPDRKRGIFATI